MTFGLLLFAIFESTVALLRRRSTGPSAQSRVKLPRLATFHVRTNCDPKTYATNVILTLGSAWHSLLTVPEQPVALSAAVRDVTQKPVLGFSRPGLQSQPSNTDAAAARLQPRPGEVQNMPPHTPVKADDTRAELRQAALEYHEFPTPGKIAIHATKQLINQHDLALGLFPGRGGAVRGNRQGPERRLQVHQRAATWLRSSPTARPCWAWATSDRWRPSR